MAAEACEIARLPQDLISAVLSRASPCDAFRAAAVSRAFRAAADSEVVWSCHLLRDLPPPADGELSSAPSSKKKLFLRRLYDGPVLLADRLMSMWLDRETGAMCYMLSARALKIVHSDNPQFWRWIPITDSWFSEGAQLMAVSWLAIYGKIHSRMFSRNSTYTAYMVYKLTDNSKGLDYPLQKASVNIGKTTPIGHQVCLGRRRNHLAVRQIRADGWMELNLGEFFNKDGEDGEVSISLTEANRDNCKSGLIVQGIEIRLKKSG